MRDGAIETRLVAAILDFRAGVADAGAVAREAAAAGRQAGAERHMMQIDGELTRAGDGGAAALSGGDGRRRDATCGGHGREAEGGTISLFVRQG